MKIDLGKTHINFKEKSSQISLILRISEINKEISIACQKYNIDFKILDYNLITKIEENEISDKIIINSLYFWIFKILFKFPLTAKAIFKSFNGLNLKKFDTQVDSLDKKISNYLNLNFTIKNLSYSNLNKNEKKVLFEKYINNFQDHYSLSLSKQFAEFSLSDAGTVEKISKVYFNKFKNKDLNENYFFGSSLYAFGHMLAFIDYHFRIKSKDIKVVMSPHWVANSCLAKYIKNRYSNSIINHYYFLKIAQMNLFTNDTRTDLFHFNNSVYNLTYKEYLNTNTVLPSIDEKVINNILKNNNYNKFTIDHKYICFFNRDTSFKKENFELNSNDQDRACDVNIFLPVINFFLKNNLKIVIMGNPGQQKIKIDNPNIIDYANSKYKNDFNDILLSKNCEFFVNGGSSSNEYIPPLFRKFSLNLERPFNRKPKFHDLAYYTIRPFYKNDKKMEFKDYFNDELFTNEDFNILKKLGYKIGYNSSNDLLNATENFWEAFNGRKNLFTKKKIKKGNIINYYNLLDF
ncbi:TIGR04372 family glycosyltransferase [Pelagibacterales bacterium SAG-MED02]|nr:TIGR04372 family glycosyltransferase [Pelagibacterales bacterium SAG-MED02]